MMDQVCELVCVRDASSKHAKSAIEAKASERMSDEHREVGCCYTHLRLGSQRWSQDQES
jgi:hypothetical protein